MGLYVLLIENRQFHFIILCINFRQRTDASASVAEHPAFGSVQSDPQPSPPDGLEPEPQQITAIHNKAFEGLDTLEILLLYGNKIKIVESDAFKGLDK